MQIIVTIKSFDNEAADYSFLIPALEETMRSAVDCLITLEEPPINTDNLVAIYFAENYREELFAFQKSVGHPEFATQNKIGDGHAQVVHVVEGQGTADMLGYHVFFSKIIPTAIVVNLYLENLIVNRDTAETELLEVVKQSKRNKNKYLRMIRHELAHIEDENNQANWTWLESSLEGDSLKPLLRCEAFHLWKEYYACRRSNFFYDADATAEEMTSLLSNLETAEAEICNLRWKYNTRKITLDEFVRLFHEYIRLALTYCCYFIVHTDRFYDYLADKLQPELYPSRLYKYVSQMWGILRSMANSYPNWNSPEYFDNLSEVILKCIEDFEVNPKDTEQGIYYSIPPKKLETKSNEN